MFRLDLEIIALDSKRYLFSHYNPKPDKGKSAENRKLALEMWKLTKGEQLKRLLPEIDCLIAGLYITNLATIVQLFGV